MRVGLFVTCLIDLMRPRIGFAALKLLEAAGCEAVVPTTQTCCGQPGYNAGEFDSPRALALRRVPMEMRRVFVEGLRYGILATSGFRPLLVAGLLTALALAATGLVYRLLAIGYKLKQ